MDVHSAGSRDLWALGEGGPTRFLMSSVFTVHPPRSPKSVALFDIYSRMIHVFSLVSIQGHHGQGSSSLGHLCVV